MSQALNATTHHLYVTAMASRRRTGRALVRRARRLGNEVTVTTSLSADALEQLMLPGADADSGIMLETTVAGETSVILQDADPEAIARVLSDLERRRSLKAPRQTSRSGFRLRSLADRFEIGFGSTTVRGPAWAVLLLAMLAFTYLTLVR